MRITITDDKTRRCFSKSDITAFVSKSHKKRLAGAAAAAACTQAQRKEKEIATWSGFRRAFYHSPGRRRNILIRDSSPEAQFLRSAKIDGRRRDVQNNQNDYR